MSERTIARDLWLDETARRAGFESGAALCSQFNLKGYRLDQIYRAATKELLASLADVTVLPKALRDELLAAGFDFNALEPVVVQTSSDAQTRKGLFRLHGGAEVEAVLMQHWGGRNTICISSQAGCAFACAFCSTGQAGFGRHLSASEIFDQARFFARELAPKGERVSNIVFMGMGEPFHNYDNVINAVRLLNDGQGFGLGHRHITISTVGVVPAIDRFADEGIQVNLAISLHAPNEELRSSFMPVNRRYSMAELLAACERYVAKTNRKVFFEYVMLAGVNDQPEHARQLAALMKGKLYHVNLIPYNSTPDADFQGTPEAKIWAFAAILEAANVPSTVRKNMGRDIAAACGQLRVETQPKAHA